MTEQIDTAQEIRTDGINVSTAASSGPPVPTRPSS